MGEVSSFKLQASGFEFRDRVELAFRPASSVTKIIGTAEAVPFQRRQAFKDAAFMDSLEVSLFTRTASSLSI